MQSETISLNMHDSLVDWSGKIKAAAEQLGPSDEQQITLDMYQQEHVKRFKGADNPYAAALADVFGLEG